MRELCLLKKFLADAFYHIRLFDIIQLFRPCFAVNAAVNVVLLIRQAENVRQLLLDRRYTARVFAF